MTKLGFFLILMVACIVHGAPHEHDKALSHGLDSESASPEIETKETKESPEETDEELSEYQDTEGKNISDGHDRTKRDDLLRALRLPSVYGLPAEGNPDMKPFAEVLAEQGQVYSR